MADGVQRVTGRLAAACVQEKRADRQKTDQPARESGLA